MKKNICIIGFGLIGGSLAKSLKAANYRGSIYAITRNNEDIKQALKDGAIDQGSSKFDKSIINNSDIIVLCTPLDSFSNIVERIAPMMKEGVIITDVGSVKASVIFSVVPAMPDHAEIVPAHPIAGKEQGGYKNATDNLFYGKKTILTPMPNRSPKAVSDISLMWDSIGSVVEKMSAAEHDRIYAAVSHVPQILAFSYAMTITNKRVNIDANNKDLGQDFSEFSRICNSSVDIWKDIIFYNKPNINTTLTRFFNNLQHLTQFCDSSKVAVKLGLQAKPISELNPIKEKLGTKLFFWSHIFPMLLSNAYLQTLSANHIVRKFTPADIHSSLEQLKVESRPALIKDYFDYAGTGLKSFSTFSAYTGLQDQIAEYAEYIEIAKALLHRKIFEITVANESGYITQLEEKLSEAKLNT